MTEHNVLWLSDSKLGNLIGLLGVTMDEKTRITRIKQYNTIPRDEVLLIPEIVEEFHKKHDFSIIGCNLGVGHYLIEEIGNAVGFPIVTLTPKGSVEDTDKIDQMKVMDLREHIYYVRSRVLDNKILLPDKKSINNNMKGFIREYEMYHEHITEQGSKSYYGPGKQPDSGMMCLFETEFYARNTFYSGMSQPIIKQGSNLTRNTTENILVQEERMLAANGFTSMGSLEDATINRMSRNNLFRPKVRF